MAKMDFDTCTVHSTMCEFEPIDIGSLMHNVLGRNERKQEIRINRLLMCTITSKDLLSKLPLFDCLVLIFIRPK